MEKAMRDYMKLIKDLDIEDDAELQEGIFEKHFTDKRRNDHKKTRVIIDDVEYDSVKEACSVMGFNPYSFVVVANKKPKGIPFSFKKHIVVYDVPKRLDESEG